MSIIRTSIVSLAAAAVCAGAFAAPAFAETTPTPAPIVAELGDPEAYLAWTSTGQASIKHPQWGTVTVRTVYDEATRRAAFVMHEGNKVIWATEFADLSSFALASPAQDSTGNVFINYNPGRHNGVIVLRPAAGEGFSVLAQPYGMIDPGALDFYNATLVGPFADGAYAIEHQSNDCTPSCSAGTISTTTWIWSASGVTYIPLEGPSDPKDPGTPKATTKPKPTTKPAPKPTTTPAPKPTTKPLATTKPKATATPKANRGVPAKTGADTDFPILPLAAGSLLAVGSTGWLIGRRRQG